MAKRIAGLYLRAIDDGKPSEVAVMGYFRRLPKRTLDASIGAQTEYLPGGSRNSVPRAITTSRDDARKPPGAS